MTKGPLCSDELRDRTLAFIERQRLQDRGPGAYRYSRACRQPTLYSSCYAAMTRSLYGDLQALPDEDRRTWVEYLQSHQDEDGLFRDPVIFDQGWYEGDPFWCGRPHLTCHVLTALACLGAIAPKAFRVIAPFARPGAMKAWLASRDFGERVAWTGNEIMNLGTLLQYARDYHNDSGAGRAVCTLLDWLQDHHLNSETGLWGSLDPRDPKSRSHAVQAAYHWWPLFFYDGRPIPYIERAVDSVLSTQNPRGGFGWGVHNPSEPLNSSACEDIDSIDPLVRMSAQTDYRRDEVAAALARAADWVLQNQTSDGAFVFIREQPFEYGHPELRGETGRGAMFPTWFRTLSLALIGHSLPDHPLGGRPWRFTQCPGFQFAPPVRS